MALHDMSDKRLLPFQGSAHLRREGGVLARLGDARELVETAADAGSSRSRGPVAAWDWALGLAPSAVSRMKRAGVRPARRAHSAISRSSSG